MSPPPARSPFGFLRSARSSASRPPPALNTPSKLPCAIPAIVSRPHSASAPLLASPPHDSATRATKPRSATGCRWGAASWARPGSASAPRSTDGLPGRLRPRCARPREPEPPAQHRCAAAGGTDAERHGAPVLRAHLRQLVEFAAGVTAGTDTRASSWCKCSEHKYLHHHPAPADPPRSRVTGD